MFGLIQDWPLRLHRILDYAASQFGSAEVVSRRADGGLDRTSYGRLRKRALQVARRLRQDGVGPGDRIATLAWNSDAHLEAWFGITGCGAVYHTVNPRLFAEQIVWIVNHGGARIIFIDACFCPLLARLIERLPALARVIVFGAAPADAAINLPGLIGYDTWLAESTGNFPWTDGDERDAAGLCYTSGTVGEPKGVLYSHRSTVLHSLSIAGTNCLSIGLRDTVLPVVPMFHVNAWGIPFAAPMVGARMVMPGSRLDGASLYELIEAESVTLAAGVPTIWMGLLDHVRRNSLRFGTLKRMIVGGSACPRSLIEAFERDHGVEVCHAWGMTETSPVGSIGRIKMALTSDPSIDPLRIKEKQGFAPFGVELKLIDDAGCDQPTDGTAQGRLMVKGWAVASAYYDDRTPILDRHGFFDTGDVATIDAHGYMSIVDRTKDVIKSGGEWISSIAIENLAVAHPQVAEAAVIGVPHPKWGERPMLILVGRDGIAPSTEDILGFLSDKIARFWMPEEVRVIDAMPHTATGKISKKTLRARFALTVPPAAANSFA